MGKFKVGDKVYILNENKYGTIIPHHMYNLKKRYYIEFLENKNIHIITDESNLISLLELRKQKFNDLLK